VWNTSSFVILTAAYSIQPYFVLGVSRCPPAARAANGARGRGRVDRFASCAAPAIYWRGWCAAGTAVQRSRQQVLVAIQTTRRRHATATAMSSRRVQLRDDEMVDAQLLSVTEASTVVCLRATGDTSPQVLTRADVLQGADEMSPEEDNRMQMIFGDRDEILFDSGWEILMGQREVVNWLRSSPEKVVAMRYGGEFNFAGGSVDKGESLDEAADRELREEFGLDASADVQLRGFSVKQTRPVRDRSNIMHNFVALADENAWLESYDVDMVNAQLQAKRDAHAALLESGEFWEMSAAEKEQVSPETVRTTHPQGGREGEREGERERERERWTSTAPTSL
jgi:8-oxo-dGTP pyrophosphatase MutT (NUDIX family)